MAALYELLGNIAMLVVVLLFLDDTLKRWGLAALARVIDGLVFFLPNFGLVALIVTGGVVISNGLSGGVAEGLEEEGFARARLFAKSLKGALLAQGDRARLGDRVPEEAKGCVLTSSRTPLCDGSTRGAPRGHVATASRSTTARLEFAAAVAHLAPIIISSPRLTPPPTPGLRFPPEMG